MNNLDILVEKLFEKAVRYPEAFSQTFVFDKYYTDLYSGYYTYIGKNSCAIIKVNDYYEISVKCYGKDAISFIFSPTKRYYYLVEHLYEKIHQEVF